MAQYSKKTVDDKVQYQKNGKDVNGATVPVDARNALAERRDGTVVDDAGEVMDPKVETDESEDEVPPVDPSKQNKGTSPPDKDDEDDATMTPSSKNTPQENATEDDGENGEDDDEDDDDFSAEDEVKHVAAQPVAPANKDKFARIKGSHVNQSEKGMGFPRKGGKTLSIFSGKPHETIRHVAGIMVPLTHAEATGDPDEKLEPKTDAEIMAKLKEMKVM